MADNCSMILLSCDKYLDVVKKHLDYLEKYWMDCPFEIYLGLERAELQYNGSLKIHVLNSDCAHWSERVIEHLNAVPTDYVLVTLDDFFVEANVRKDILNLSLETIKKNTQIANISFKPYIGEKLSEKQIDCFDCRKKVRPSLVNWQIGIWDKKTLISLLSPEESPWESELYGSLRARYCCNKEFYCVNENSKPIDYGEGWLIVRGKWNSLEVNRIEEKCGIPIEPRNRPVEEIKAIQEPFIHRLKNRLKLTAYQMKLMMKGTHS